MNYIKLFTDTNVIIMGLKNLLETSNIPYYIKDRVEAARLGGFGEQQAFVEIYVLKKDLEQAKNILSAYKLKINA